MKIQCQEIDAKSALSFAYAGLEPQQGIVGSVTNPADIYGQMTYSGWQELANHLDFGAIDSMLDLGSGLGQVVMHSALAFNLSLSVGIEKDKTYCQRAECALQRALTWLADNYCGRSLECYYLNNCMFDCDWSGYDLVFVNATCFSGEFWNEIQRRLGQLATGTTVVITSHTLPKDKFKCSHFGTYSASWGLVHAGIYLRI
jgi:hypothetical protein